MDRLLDDAKRMVLAWPGTSGPLLTPMAFWWDGRHIWFSTAGRAGKVAALDRDGACAAYVQSADEAEDGALVRGTARVFRATDVVAMATHGALVATAQTALAIKNYASVAGYVRDATLVPARWLPTGRVMVRVEVESIDEVRPPAIGPGIAPALPTAVPPEVRRVLSGGRRIVMATAIDGGLGLMPAVWGAGMAVTLPAGMAVPDGTPVSVVVDHDPGFRPTEVAGVMVTGTYAAGRITARRVRWWSGFDSAASDVAGDLFDPIVIPD